MLTDNQNSTLKLNLFYLSGSMHNLNAISTNYSNFKKMECHGSENITLTYGYWLIASDRGLFLIKSSEFCKENEVKITNCTSIIRKYYIYLRQTLYLTPVKAPL